MSTSNRQIKRRADDRASRRLLEYAWVAPLERFVKISDPLNPQHTYKADAFNEVFDELASMLGTSPNDYLRVNNKKHRVVARMEMYPGETDRIVSIPKEFPLKALNISAQPPVPELPDNVGPDDLPPMFLAHLDYLFDGDTEKVGYFLAWLAHLVFRPETRMHHGIMISGGQGTGKSFLGHVVQRLIGEQSFLETNVAKMKGRFNAFISGKRCMLVEEVTDNNGSDFYNSLKAYFTSPTIPLEVKHGPVLNIQNHTHWLLLSNSRRPLAIDKDDRRLFYIHSNATPMDCEYYTVLWGSVDDELALLYRHLERGILPKLSDDFATTPPPKTEDHRQLAQVSEDDLKVLLEDRLDAGAGFFAPGILFDWLDFKAHVDMECRQKGVKNQRLKLIFLELGGTLERVTIDGRKTTRGWFQAGNEDLRELFKDNSIAGREALKRRLYRDASHEFSVIEGCVL